MENKKIKLIDTSIHYDDGSIDERYTDTGDMRTYKYKAVPCEYRGNKKVPRYFKVYDCFGCRVERDEIYKTLKECEEMLTVLEKESNICI